MSDVAPTAASAEPKRTSRKISEREIAIALVMEYAESQTNQFSLADYAYDDDAEFLEDVATRLNVVNDEAFLNKLRKVTRRLVRYGVMHAEMKSTQKYYVGEPTHQMRYWLRDGKADLIRRGRTAVTMSPEGETAFLLRHAYPDPDF